jgi:hypothetical protein
MTVFLLVLLIFAISLLMIGLRGIFYKKKDLLELKMEERNMLSEEKISDDSDVTYMMNLLKNDTEDKSKDRKSKK